jgi:ribose 5-phosphate isomerase A
VALPDLLRPDPADTGDDMVDADDARALDAAAARALDLVTDGARIGLGSGRAAAHFVAALGARVRSGLGIIAVPTSAATARQARDLGIPLVELDEELELDLTVDGADEVAPNLDLVKGWGGALVRERVVASASRRQIILVGEGKLVRALGERGRIPVEVVPFARGPVLRRMRALGLHPRVRAGDDGCTLVTENGNLVLDAAPSAPLADGAAARRLDAALRAIPGVVDTGLFLGTAERVLVGHADGHVDELRGTR